MALSDIVNVVITTQTQAVTQKGFGTPLVMAFHTVFPERFRIYTSTSDMLTDGFVANDPAVRAVGTLFSQNPRPIEAIVGRQALAPTQTLQITPIEFDSTTYQVIINGTVFQFISDASATVAEITLGLAAAVNGGSEPVTAADNTTNFDLTADVAGDLFTFEVNSRALLTQSNTTADPGIFTDLADVQAENDDWYSLHLTSLGSAEILEAARFIEERFKIFGYSTADDDVLTGSTTDIMSLLKAAGRVRTYGLYHPKSMIQYAGAGWSGGLLPKDPGSVTWKFKTIAGVDVTVLTATEINFVEGKNGNTYTEVGGVSITQQGVTAAGEFIDITRFSDFIVARLQERILSRLVNLDKIPFTDPGIAVVEAEVRGVMQLGIDVGGFAADPAPTVTVPLAADVAATDKINRLLPDVNFEATLAGAIHATTISGVISV